MSKTTSNAGITLLKQFEGCRLKAYKALPSEQYYTIGYGHYGPDITANMTITQVQAETMLKSDLKRYEKPVNDCVTVDITQNMFDALVSFTYNCGGAALKGSTLLKKLNTKDYSGAAAEFPKWNKSGSQVIAGLTKRRAAEAELFLKGYNIMSKPKENITRNSYKDDIKWLQNKLNKAVPDCQYTPFKLDGIFSPKVRIAVLSYWEFRGWNQDGKDTGWIVGPGTREALAKL